MNLHPKLERFLMTSCDQFFSAFPQKRPAKKLLEDCQIISHRGIHDQREIKENTMDAFVLAEEKGVYGIELDFRWTCLLYTSPSPRDRYISRMPSSA